MDRQTFTWGRSGSRIHRTQRWVERMWLLGLLLAALLLFSISLDSPPLLDWGEKTINLVAREISKTSQGSWQWFYPTFKGQPYLEEPPFLYWLIACTYNLVGNSEWTTRLPGAILSALSVPLLYGIGREIFPSRQSAIFSSLIYLTLLPVVHYGRLAIVDGTALCFVMFMMWSVLRSRRDLRWALGAGIGLALICLTKGLLLGFLFLAIALLFLSWDTPRLLTSGYWWLGWFLGMAPGLAWYGIPLLYGQTFITMGLLKQTLQPLGLAVGDRHRSPWYYLVELLKFSVPWLLFWPYGLWLGWENRNWGWAKLVLVWVGVYGVAISLIVTKLPWYALPLYPALALAGGMQLAEVWHWPSRKSFPRAWIVGLSLMALLAAGVSIYLVVIDADISLPVISALVALTMAIAAILVAKRDLQFIAILFWGMYVSLMLFVTSPYWTWNWQEAESVEPVATSFQLSATPEYSNSVVQ